MAHLCTRWALVLMASVCLATGASADTPGPSDWPTYGHDIGHTFHGVTTLDKLSVQTLAPAWFFPTGDAVTANPIVAAGTVYVGSWDGWFYAIDAKTGKQRWARRLKPQPAVSPHTSSRPRQSGRLEGYLQDLLDIVQALLGGNPTAVGNAVQGLANAVQSDTTSDGGLVTSSAYFLAGDGSRPDLVIFGGGYTLYALRAADGDDYFTPHDYPGLPESAADPAHDEARIFSSPVVVGDQILFGLTSDGQNGHRGYFVSADLTTGNPNWIFETDVDANGVPQNDGCGGVWASPTIDEQDGLLFIDVADCNFLGNAGSLDSSGQPVRSIYNERVLALKLDPNPSLTPSQRLVWVFTPPRLDPSSPRFNHDPPCDWDFGATLNYQQLADGSQFLGVGGKDGSYYRLDPKTGDLKWETNVVYGGFSGGFIGTTAFDGTHAYGATALGDFGRFEGFGAIGCQPGQNNTYGNPDLLIQEPSVFAFGAGDGSVTWKGILSQSFGPTTVAGDMVFLGTGIAKEIQIRDAATGLPLKIIPLPASSDSGVIVAGNAIYFGTGSSEQGIPAGVYKFKAKGRRLLKKLEHVLPLP
jgi:outer membrane protein assembly factor BamB